MQKIVKTAEAKEDIKGIVDLAKEMLDVADRKTFKANSSIFNEGEEDKNFYILLDGRIGITKKTSEGEEKVIAELSRGDFLGEGVLTGQFKKPTGAKALAEVTALVLSHETFESLIHDNPRVAANVLQKVLEVENGRMTAMNTKLITLFEIDHLLNEYKDQPEHIAKAIVEKLIQVTSAQAGAVYLQVPFTEGYRTVFTTEEILKIENKNDIDLSHSHEEHHDKGHYLILHLENVGAIVLKGDVDFDDDELRLLNLIADQLGSALENAHFKKVDHDRQTLHQQRITL